MHVVQPVARAHLHLPFWILPLAASHLAVNSSPRADNGASPARTPSDLIWMKHLSLSFPEKRFRTAQGYSQAGPSPWKPYTPRHYQTPKKPQAACHARQVLRPAPQLKHAGQINPSDGSRWRPGEWRRMKHPPDSSLRIQHGKTTTCTASYALPGGCRPTRKVLSTLFPRDQVH